MSRISLFPTGPGLPIPEGTEPLPPDEPNKAPWMPKNYGCDPVLGCGKALIIFIGGGRDWDHRPMYDTFKYYCEEGHQHQSLAYFTYEQATNEIRDYIIGWKKQFQGHGVGLIGHSWGGWRSYLVAAALARKDVTLDLLFTLDPVTNTPFPSTTRDGMPEKLPPERPDSVSKWLNVYVRDTRGLPLHPRAGSPTANTVANVWGGGAWTNLKALNFVDGERTIENSTENIDGIEYSYDNGHARARVMFDLFKTDVVDVS